MTTVDETKMVRPPVHPGEILREDVLPAIAEEHKDVDARTFVLERTGLSLDQLVGLLNETLDVTPAIAEQLGKIGGGPEIWLNLQARLNDYRARA